MPLITLEHPPLVIKLGLPAPIARRGERKAVSWAEANRAALLDYWENGALWTRDGVSLFIDGLAKLP
jgi:hypothetical protein